MFPRPSTGSFVQHMSTNVKRLCSRLSLGYLQHTVRLFDTRFRSLSSIIRLVSFSVHSFLIDAQRTWEESGKVRRWDIHESNYNAISNQSPLSVSILLSWRVCWDSTIVMCECIRWTPWAASDSLLTSLFSDRAGQCIFNTLSLPSGPANHWDWPPLGLSVDGSHILRGWGIASFQKRHSTERI